VDLRYQPDDLQVWQVSDVECRYVGADKLELEKLINRGYVLENWQHTWLGRQYQSENWRQFSAAFTKEEDDFAQITLLVEGAKHQKQRGDGLLWLQRDGQKPHRALLLMWFLPPPMTSEDIVLLSQIARLFSALENRRYEHQTALAKLAQDEQAAQFGYVMQHFRHRLGNLTGSQLTHIEDLAEAFDEQDDAMFNRVLQRLRVNSKEFSNSFNKAKCFIKNIEKTNIHMKALVNLAKSDLLLRLEAVRLIEELDDSFIVLTDPDIASLIIYSLLENALDALQDRKNPEITLRSFIDFSRPCHLCLQIHDNGPGIAEAIRTKLFQWGYTTKANGLGSALAFARTRAELLGASLECLPLEENQGAIFQICFPPALKD